MRVEARDCKRLEQLSRHITRPALSDERVQLNAAGQVELKPKSAWPDVTTHEAECDVLAFMTFPRAHWKQIYGTNPLERLNAEIKRRTDVVGIFPTDASIVRLVGAMMLEHYDEESLNRRYRQLEGLQTVSDRVPTRLSAVAR